MECEVKKQRTHQRNRRRERAQRMQAQRESKAASGQIAGDSGEDESPVREKPPRPPNRRKKLKEPLYEEDIIDGFAILAFKSYEDLENAVKKHSEKHHAARHNNNVHLAAAAQARASSKPAKLHQDTKQPPGPSPPPPRLHHLHVLHNGAPPPANGAALQQGFESGGGGGSSSPGPEQRLNGPSGGLSLRDGSRDDRLSDASSHSSSGRGYICDSESDDDKASDAGSDLFTTSRKREFSGELRRPQQQQPDLVPRGELPASPRRSSSSNNALPPPPPPPPPSLPGVISLRVPHRPSRRPLGPQQPASARASPDSPPPRLLSSASPPPSAAGATAAAAADTSATGAAAPVAPSSAPPPYPPLYAPYSTATVPGTAPSPYLAPSSPGANAAIHRNEQQQQRHSKSPLAKPPNHQQAPPGVPPPHMSPLQAMAGQPPPGLWAPAVAPPPSSVPAAVAGHRELPRPHSPRGHSPTRERDSYSSNVSSLSRGSSTTPATCPAPSSPFGVPPSCAPAVSASPGGLLSFSSKSPVVSASVGAAWTGVALNPPASAPSAAAGSPSISVAQHSGPFAPPTSAPSSLFPQPLPVSSSASSSVSAPAPTSSTATGTTIPPPVPPNPNPFSAESLFGSSQAADLLTRKLDNRFLVSSQERGSLGAPPFLRAEMQHHQHQHTHVHQHTTPLLPPGCSAPIPPPTLDKLREENQREVAKAEKLLSKFEEKKKYLESTLSLASLIEIAETETVQIKQNAMEEEKCFSELKKLLILEEQLFQRTEDDFFVQKMYDLDYISTHRKLMNIEYLRLRWPNLDQLREDLPDFIQGMPMFLHPMRPPPQQSTSPESPRRAVSPRLGYDTVGPSPRRNRAAFRITLPFQERRTCGAVDATSTSTTPSSTPSSAAAASAIIVAAEKGFDCWSSSPSESTLGMPAQQEQACIRTRNNKSENWKTREDRYSRFPRVGSKRPIDSLSGDGEVFTPDGKQLLLQHEIGITTPQSVSTLQQDKNAAILDMELATVDSTSDICCIANEILFDRFHARQARVSQKILALQGRKDSGGKLNKKDNYYLTCQENLAKLENFIEENGMGCNVRATHAGCILSKAEFFFRGNIHLGSLTKCHNLLYNNYFRKKKEEQVREFIQD